MNPDPAARESQSDIMDPARAAALQAALGQVPDIAAGSALPPFFHHLYFWSARPPGDLGRDGHPRTGGLIPDLGLPRRMWAGGRLQFAAPLRAGQMATRHSTVAEVTQKTGRTGDLGFVTLRHDIEQGGKLCVREWQDLVYRADPDTGPQVAKPSRSPTPKAARRDETTRVEVGFTTTLLFRYSALTFNGHRIHYDRDYARNVEGYEGLVVHGPLLAQHLMLLATETLGPLSGFAFRANAALMDFETAELCANGTSLWVRGPDGRQIMTATATPA